jgi:NAD-dependent deacetylase
MSLKKLQEYIDGGKEIVFFGGAGVSTESGLADFRGEDGLFRQKYNYTPEHMLSYGFFLQKPEIFYEFHRAKMLPIGYEPNAAHYKLAELEKAGKLKAVITQNIDGFHQKAGSRNVLELHGSVYRNYCMECHKEYSLEFIASGSDVPHCSCGGVIRPDVVLYGEALDNFVLSRAVESVTNADVFIVGGTSLNVYPAAGLLNYYRGDKLVLINKDATSFDKRASLLIHGKIGEILSAVKVR